MIRLFLWMWGFLAAVSASAAPLEDSELQQYFEGKVRQMAAVPLREIESREQWEALKPAFRAQLFENLGLSPLPEKGDLHPVITGKVEREDFVVEKLHFQSLPGLYVTANFYLPRQAAGPLPTILYVCGHSLVKEHGVSYGNKAAYQHHGAWFARNGYACLVIDTLQLGEIEGLHHGTYREGMWWWNSRGYTPAGVEAWNCLRALDYLETRPEVDKTRFGVTGRSGGGAYSWWITALDDRIKVAAPVAGITDLQNQVADGVVEGHCDCMFFVNTARWDYPLIAALAAPRPLLICNSDKDSIFPLDGVMRTHAQARRIYEFYGASTNLGVLITEGPHEDTQDLQVPVFRWFNRFLKHESPPIEMAARKFFTPQELKVFDKIPDDERNTRIYETFVPRVPERDPARLRSTLRTKSFGAWPASPPPVQPTGERQWNSNGHELRLAEFYSEPKVRLRLFYYPGDETTDLRLVVLGEEDLPGLAQIFREELGINIGFLTGSPANYASLDWLRPIVRDDSDSMPGFLIVRGEGSANAKKAVQVRRRYMLVGGTLDSMRVFDIQRGVEMLRACADAGNLPLQIFAAGRNAANVALYAALAENPPGRITLRGVPQDEKDQPDYLNFGRYTSLAEVMRQLPAGGFGKPVIVVTE